MNFTVHRTAFARSLKLAASVADRKSTMPLLANVLLTAGDGAVRVVATDLTVSVTSSTTADVKKPGAMTIAAKVLLDMVALCPGDEVTLTKLDANWCEVKSGRVRYKVAGLPDRDFPKVASLEDGQWFAVETDALRSLIDRTIFSVCSDETRFHMAGCHLISDGATIRMVSTDGHRLSTAVVEARAFGTKGITIPRKGLTEIKAAIAGVDTCQIATDRGHLFVTAASTTVAVKLIDAQYPPWEQVVPKSHKRTTTVDRCALLDAIKRTGLMASDTRGIKLAIAKDGITLTATDPNCGEVVEEIAAESNSAGAVGCNPAYIAELVGQMTGDQIELRTTNDLDPVLIVDGNYTGVIMPMRM